MKSQRNNYFNKFRFLGLALSLTRLAFTPVQMNANYRSPWMVNSFLFSSVLVILSVSAKTLSHIWIDHISILNSSYCTVSDNSRDTQPKLALPCPWAALNRHSKMRHKPCHSQNSISNQFLHSSSSGSPDRSELAGYFHQGFLLSTALCWEAAGVEDNFPLSSLPVFLPFFLTFVSENAHGTPPGSNQALVRRLKHFMRVLCSEWLLELWGRVLAITPPCP